MNTDVQTIRAQVQMWKHLTGVDEHGDRQHHMGCGHGRPCPGDGYLGDDWLIAALLPALDRIAGQTQVNYRVLWYERLAGIENLVPFSGRVRNEDGTPRTFADVATEAENRRKCGRYHGVMIEARPESREPWPRPWDETDAAMRSESGPQQPICGMCGAPAIGSRQDANGGLTDFCEPHMREYLGGLPQQQPGASEFARRLNSLTPEQIATAMEKMPTDALEWGVRFEAAGHGAERGER